MKFHVEDTDTLLQMAGVDRSMRILDCGAGDGQSRVSDAIDLVPRHPSVTQGDYLALPYADETFDAVLSQCAYFLSGDVPGALKEARRVLKKGGKLIYSDVYQERPVLDGFTLEQEQDLTDEWREYYLERLWSDEPVCIPGHMQKHKKIRYGIFIARKD